jgi:hypothetical protein
MLSSAGSATAQHSPGGSDSVSIQAEEAWVVGVRMLSHHGMRWQLVTTHDGSVHLLHSFPAATLQLDT